MSVALTLLWAADASAQTESHDDYAQAPLQAGSLLGVWGSNPLEPGRYALGLGMQVRPPLWNDPAAGAVSSLEALATVGLWHRLDISGGITAQAGSPVRSSAEATDSAQGRSAAVGDVRLIPRWRLWGENAAAGLALAVPMWIPAGNASAYREQGLRVEPRVLASYFGKLATLSTNLGYLFQGINERPPLGPGGAITGAVGADVPVLDAWSVVTEVSSRWHLHGVAADTRGRLPVEIRAAGRFSIASWVAQLGGGVGVRHGASQPDWRLLAAVGFSPSKSLPSRPITPPSDRDRDRASTADESDPCLDEARRGASGPEGCASEHSAQVVADNAAQQPAEVQEAVLEEFPIEVTGEDNRPVQIRDVLYFEPNEMRLAPAQLALLDAVVLQLLAAPPDAQLVVEGHSDALGPPQFNSSLSWMRASTVRFYLIQRGVSWRRLLIIGYGSSRPIGTGLDEASRASNRRVEFRLVPK